MTGRFADRPRRRCSRIYYSKGFQYTTKFLLFFFLFFLIFLQHPQVGRSSQFTFLSPVFFFSNWLYRHVSYCHGAGSISEAIKLINIKFYRMDSYPPQLSTISPDHYVHFTNFPVYDFFFHFRVNMGPCILQWKLRYLSLSVLMPVQRNIGWIVPYGYLKKLLISIFMLILSKHMWQFKFLNIGTYEESLSKMTLFLHGLSGSLHTSQIFLTILFLKKKYGNYKNFGKKYETLHIT